MQTSTGLIILFLLLTGFVHAQPFSQNLYFKKSGQPSNFKDTDYKPSKKGFYIYRNCFYNLALKNKVQVMAKVTDIRNDSIYYTKSLNDKPANPSGIPSDTFSLHPSQIRKIRLIGDRIMGIYSVYSLRNHQYVFEQSVAPKKFDPAFREVFSKDSSQSVNYELVPYLTAQGLDVLYEQCGVTYYYRGITNTDCPDSVPVKKPLVKKGVWFTPSNANEIRGINVGLMTTNLKDEGLAINGVNLNADLFSFLLGGYAFFFIPFNNALVNMPDSIDTTKLKNRINGVSISAGGLVLIDQVKGVAINGGICTVTQLKGLVITGTQNIVEEFEGVVLSGLRNKSIKGKGVQIGLLNICKHLKGIQIGLWNVNSKRKLPFINWSF